MTCEVFTARLGAYQGPDALNITRKSAAREGLIWAPSWELLGPFLRARKLRPLTDLDWANYAEAFVKEMRHSYAEHRTQWRSLLGRPSLTLLCYCSNSRQCHRTLLARDILPMLGATYRGERKEVQHGLA
jgi:hypothetical protein